MASFKEVRDLLLLEHSNGLISDDELLFFMGEYQSKNPEFTYDIYERFNLDDMEEPECKAYFRFEKNDIPVLAETLGLPDFFKCTQRTVAGKIEGLCLVLRRMAYPCRLGDLIPVFGRPVPELSMIANCVLEEIYDLHAHRQTNLTADVSSGKVLLKPRYNSLCTKSREDLEEYGPYVPPAAVGENGIPSGNREKSHGKKSSFFGLFRSSSDPDFHANSKTRRSFSWRKKSPAKRHAPEGGEYDKSLPVNGVDSLPLKTHPVDDELPVDQILDDKLDIDRLSTEALQISELPGYSLPVGEPVPLNNSLPIDSLFPEDPSWRRAKEIWEKNETGETKEERKKRHKDKKKKREESKERRRHSDKAEKSERKREKEEKKRDKSEKRERSRERSKDRKKDRDSSKHRDKEKDRSRERDRSGSKHRSKDRTRRDSGDSHERQHRPQRSGSDASNDSRRGTHRSRKHKHRLESEKKAKNVKKIIIHELDNFELDSEGLKEILDKLDGLGRLKRKADRSRDRSRSRESQRSRERVERSQSRSCEYHKARRAKERERRRKMKGKEKHVYIDSEDSYHCHACQRSLLEFEARQEQCSADIDSARRSIEHKIQRLEKKFDQQFSSTEKNMDKNDSSLPKKEIFQQIVTDLSDEFQKVTRNLEVRTSEMKNELSVLVQEKPTDWTRETREAKSRSIPRTGKVLSPDRGLVTRSSPILWPSGSRGENKAVVIDDKSCVEGNAQVRVSQSNALDTLNEPQTNVKKRTSHYHEGTSSDSTAEALKERDQDLAEDLFEKFINVDQDHVCKDRMQNGHGIESPHNEVLSDDAAEALRIKYLGQIKDLERQYREQPPEEQEALQKRIEELESLLGEIRTSSS
ncbi:predicted protein [Nematostella vectensis]|uniref:Uncharacterized protein n=1 Tax=Nematostella vectensis TaxID=45351 RepID=A7RV08_NEMVE|nr:predicted protein [Nematostella vectensis]|eukprot:XP_001636769.1 predicted protein [Nematostella vectensis]